jgi:hypothetical protein
VAGRAATRSVPNACVDSTAGSNCQPVELPSDAVGISRRFLLPYYLGRFYLIKMEENPS